MILVEIYDEEVIDNVAASLKFKNDELIFIGYNLRNMQKGIDNIENFFKHIKREINISCVEVVKNNLELMLEALENLINSDFYDNDEFVFNITGGDDLILVAMGIIAERYNVKLISFDAQKSKILWQTENVDQSKYEVNEGKSSISVRSSILLHGGEIVGPENTPAVYYNWDFCEDFINDVNNMWTICRNDCLRWNKEISELQTFYNKETGIIKGKANYIMSKLYEIGVIDRCEDTTDEAYVFKNECIKESLMKVGTVLELYICVTAMGMKKEDGTPFFSDVKNSVNIDWDGVIHDIHDADKDTRNEIDVILVKGVCPIFVSCKNGDVGIDELYKLNTVAERFGGKYAKKVLIITYFAKKGVAWDYFVQRAHDMKIQIISDAHKLDDNEFIKRFSNI
ncbi:MAG: DUF1887 family protein [Lachnospiraceae bacterium]|nr:DUF1887 family protein [Lachnospiraceae bacterium]